jgi:subtilisin family serine protease
MWVRHLAVGILMAVFLQAGASAEELTDPARDILVTFDNKGAGVANGGLGAPYRNRKRYSIGRSVRRDSAAVMAEHNLTEIEHWPIRSLSVYCFVYRVPDGVERSVVIARLNADERVESAQPLQRFETSMDGIASYDDTYANLQYGLDVLDITAAHRASLGSGVRVAIVDSHADKNHEDLRGRITRVEVFSNHSETADNEHGTAVASVIGARSNNALGIVGVAPQAALEIFVACWSNGPIGPAVCDSFSLSKALDRMLDDPPPVLNISLNGPQDPLLQRLLSKMLDSGSIIVAAGSTKAGTDNEFPASMDRVIGVASSTDAVSVDPDSNDMLFAPGDRILVAVPVDAYDFRSGSSLAAAHVSGVVAFLLARAPHLSAASVRDILQRSQDKKLTAHTSINACAALNLAGFSEQCGERLPLSAKTEYE